MEFMGHSARMCRLVSEKDGRYFGLAVDHSMARGVMRGLDTLQQTIDDMCAGGPDAITMHRRLTEWYFGQHAGITPLILKCATFSPYQPDLDTSATTIGGGVRLGVDAVSVGYIVCRDRRPRQLSTLVDYYKKVKELGMPVIPHMYPRGNCLKDDARYDWKSILYAVRAAAEPGVDLIETNYTGDPESFARVVEGTPSMVAIAGGDNCRTSQELLKMTKDALDSGAMGVTYGRFTIQYPKITPIVKAIKSIIYGGYSVKEVMELPEELKRRRWR